MYWCSCVCSQYLNHCDDMAGVEQVEQLPGADLVADLYPKHKTQHCEQQSLANKGIRFREGLGHGVCLPPKYTHHYHHGRGEKCIQHHSSPRQEVGTLLTTVPGNIRVDSPIHYIGQLLPERAHLCH